MAVAKTKSTKAVSGTVAAVALPIAAVVAFHKLGSLDWLRIDFADMPTWLDQTPIEDIMASTLRYVGLIGGYWLSISSALYLLARLSGATRLINATAILTLPAVRRATDRLVMGTLAASTLAVPAIGLSGHVSHYTQTSNEMTDPIEVRMSAVDTIPTAPDLMASEDPPQTVDRPVPTASKEWQSETNDRRNHTDSVSITVDDIEIRVTVTDGDHLWGLAENRITDILGRQAQDHEIAPYWRDVIAANSHLRSGNPDVIYPGEVVVLPPL